MWRRRAAAVGVGLMKMRREIKRTEIIAMEITTRDVELG